MIEKITDANYEDFRNSPRSALVVTTSWCAECKKYEPFINTLSKQMPYVRFGKIVLDKDRSSQLKKQYPNIGSWTLPTTLLFKNKKEITKLHGGMLYPTARNEIKKSLILESDVFVPGNNGDQILARIKYDHGNGLYLVQLAQDSLFGSKNSSVELTQEKFKWNL